MQEILEWLKSWYERESHFCAVGGTEGEYPVLVKNLGLLLEAYTGAIQRAEAAEAKAAYWEHAYDCLHDAESHPCEQCDTLRFQWEAAREAAERAGMGEE